MMHPRTTTLTSTLSCLPTSPLSSLRQLHLLTHLLTPLRSDVLCTPLALTHIVPLPLLYFSNLHFDPLILFHSW